MSCIRKYFLWALFLLSGWVQICAQDSLSAQINKLGAATFEKSKAPGLLVATLQDGKMNYYTWGYADSAQQKKFDLNTVFEAASITKTFTAYVVAKVLTQKGIADTASIFPYLPDSVQSNTALRSISFLSLLNHTAGLPRLPTNIKPANALQPYADYTIDKLFTYLKTAVPKPDGKSQYSNLGAGLAGMLAARISGKNYQALLQEFVFRPFGISNSKKPTQQPQAVGYNGSKPVPFWKWDILQGAGGLRCSAKDLLQYLEDMAVPKNKKEAAFMNGFLQPTVRIGSKVRLARGWHTLEVDKKPVVYWHNGGSYGLSTFAAFTPGQNRAVVVVANSFGINDAVDKLGIAVFYSLLN